MPGETIRLAGQATVWAHGTPLECWAFAVTSIWRDKGVFTREKKA